MPNAEISACTDRQFQKKSVLLTERVKRHLLGQELGTPVSWAREEGQKGQTPAALREEVSTPAATREGRKSKKAGEYTASAISCSALPAVLSSATESCMEPTMGLSTRIWRAQSRKVEAGKCAACTMCSSTSLASFPAPLQLKEQARRLEVRAEVHGIRECHDDYCTLLQTCEQTFSCPHKTPSALAALERPEGGIFSSQKQHQHQHQHQARYGRSREEEGRAHLEIAAQALHVEVKDAQCGDGARVAAQDAAQLDGGVVEGALGAAGRPLYCLIGRLCALTCRVPGQSLCQTRRRHSMRMRFSISLHAPGDSFECVCRR